MTLRGHLRSVIRDEEVSCCDGQLLGATGESNSASPREDYIPPLEEG